MAAAHTNCGPRGVGSRHGLCLSQGRCEHVGSACSRAARASPAHGRPVRSAGRRRTCGCRAKRCARRRQRRVPSRGRRGQGGPTRGELGGVGAPEEQHLLRVVGHVVAVELHTLLNQAAAVLRSAGRPFLRSFLRQRTRRQGEKKHGRGNDNLCSQLLAISLRPKLRQHNLCALQPSYYHILTCACTHVP